MDNLTTINDNTNTVDNANISLLDMAQIASGNMQTISNDTAISTKSQLQIFLIAQAQRELTRVIKLTDMLDKLQDRYIDKATEYMNAHDDANSSVLYLPSMIDTIAKCLDSSNKIISQVLGNDKIMNFQIVSDNSTNITNINSHTNSAIPIDLQDPASRLKVREAVNAILSSIHNDTDIIDNIDSSSTDTQVDTNSINIDTANLVDTIDN